MAISIAILMMATYIKNRYSFMAINKRVDSIGKGERLGALVNHSLKQDNFNFFEWRKDE